MRERVKAEGMDKPRLTERILTVTCFRECDAPLSLPCIGIEFTSLRLAACSAPTTLRKTKGRISHEQTVLLGQRAVKTELESGKRIQCHESPLPTVARFLSHLLVNDL